MSDKEQPGRSRTMADQQEDGSGSCPLESETEDSLSLNALSDQAGA